jgi:hypothetical protein
MSRSGMKTTDLLFDLSYGLYLLFALLSTSLYFKYFEGTPYKLILLFSVLLLVIREWMLDQITVRTLFYAAICMILMVLVIKNNNVFSLALIFLYIFAARNTNEKQMIRISFWISLLVLTFVIVSSRIGIINNFLEFTSGRVRHYEGFTYSLYAPTIMFNLIALYLWRRKRKVRWVELLIMLLLQIWICNRTDSRLTLYCGILCIALFGIWKLFPKLLSWKPAAFVMTTSYLWCAGLSLVLTASYTTKSGWMLKLNELLGERLRLGHDSLQLYGARLFGQKVSWQGNGLDLYGKRAKVKYTYVDNMYQQFLQRYGLIFLCILLALLTILMVHCYQTKQYQLMIILFVLAIHGMIDDLIFYLYFNTLWLSIGIYLFSKKNRSEIRSDIRQEEKGNINGSSN